MFASEDIRAAQRAAVRLVDDPHPLLWTPLESGLAPAIPRVRDRASLRAFLDWYREELLLPVELPAIGRAYGHLIRYEPRELAAADRRLGRDKRIAPLAAASRAVGRSQLRRLLPMRDQRLVRRYYAAVEEGRAHGWHLMVYGVVLGLFSLPLRQGLIHYGQQTLRGFIDRASGPLGLGAEERRELAAEHTEAFATWLRRPEIGPGGPPFLQLCR